MTERSNKRLVEHYFEAWSSGDERGLNEILADDFHYNDPSGTDGDKSAYLAFTRGMKAAFPDMRTSIERILADGDDITVRFHVEGTQKGEFFGVPATGRHVAADGISIVHVKNGKVQEDITEVDMLRVMQQLGAAPAPSGQPSPGS